MIIKQIIGTFLTGLCTVFVMIISALSFYQQLSNLNTKILAATFGVSVGVITVLSIVKKILKYIFEM